MITVDLRKVLWGDGFAHQAARKVWQVLFNLYVANNGSLDRMNEMLCDHNWLNRLFATYDPFEMYWFMDPGYHQTFTQAYWPYAAKYGYKIVWDGQFLVTLEEL